MTDARLSAPTALRLREVLRKTAGLVFEDDMLFVVERKLRDRVAALAMEDFETYVGLLESGTPDGRREIDEALDLVTTHETYFFREEYQLAAFEEHILPVVAQSARRRLSILSAGCSTGEEAVTIAIAVHRSLGQQAEVRVLGVDVSRRCVQTARKAVYAKSAFRGRPELAGPPWFEEVQGGFRPIERIRASCTFTQGNLLEEGRLTLGTRFDVVFCRNVLIYLDPESRKHVIATLFDRLVPGGYLLLGHSESLLHTESPFESVNAGDAIVYRRPIE